MYKELLDDFDNLKNSLTQDKLDKMAKELLGEIDFEKSAAAPAFLAALKGLGAKIGAKAGISAGAKATGAKMGGNVFQSLTKDPTALLNVQGNVRQRGGIRGIANQTNNMPKPLQAPPTMPAPPAPPPAPPQKSGFLKGKKRYLAAGGIGGYMYGKNTNNQQQQQGYPMYSHASLMEKALEKVAEENRKKIKDSEIIAGATASGLAYTGLSALKKAKRAKKVLKS